MPLVSVVVPNYNHGRYLSRRLESILTQTFSDFELIFLDDASTDDSLAVFNLYSKDPRIRFSLSRANSGSPFKQWNRGLAMATGKYIWIAESDDFSAPTFLSSLVPLLENDPDCGIALCQSYIVGPEDEVTGTFTYGQFADSSRWLNDFRAQGVNELSRYFTIANVIPNASAVLFRAELLSKGISAPEDMRLAGDWMFWVRLLEKADLSYLAAPLNYFRDVHHQSQRFRASNAGLEILEGLLVYEHIVRTVELTRAEKIRTLGSRIRHWMYVRRNRKHSREIDKAILKKIETLATGVYGESTVSVRLHILLRAMLYSAVQLPLLKGTLGPVWYFLRRSHNIRQMFP